MKIHLIAIGGSVMHNLAITLQKAGHVVSGSDDEIYEPARSRLEKYGLLPKKDGWDETRINEDLDLVVLGMHARKDNPELVKARTLGIRVTSFPAFIYKHSKEKMRIVVAGSHGKTTTTSMILHILKEAGFNFDYLVGAQIEGFETMVHLSEAEVIVIEGDEYLSSALDPVPKIWHYRPQLAVITGIAWDHMNVFPTESDYLAAFEGLLDRMPANATLFVDGEDRSALRICQSYQHLKVLPYQAFKAEIRDGVTYLEGQNGAVPLRIFGHHNLKNLKAAYEVIKALNIDDQQFLESIQSFKGADKRLQVVQQGPDFVVYQDFAHAPSKVRATTAAVKSLYPKRKLTACLELHTYSSLNQVFLPQYHSSLQAADRAIVFFSPHTIKMKKMPPINTSILQKAFGRSDLEVFDDPEHLKRALMTGDWNNHNLLMMSSGTFGGLDLSKLIT